MNNWDLVDSSAYKILGPFLFSKDKGIPYVREIGNRNFDVEFDFLKDHYNEMPRTMLRYAIEKFEPDLRQRFIKGRV